MFQYFSVNMIQVVVSSFFVYLKISFKNKLILQSNKNFVLYNSIQYKFNVNKKYIYITIILMIL